MPDLKLNLPIKPRWIAQSAFILFVFAGLATSFFATSHRTTTQWVRTEAVVLKVRDYPRRTIPEQLRILVRFEYQTETGKRYVRSRRVRVRSYGTVNVGDRITVKYRKNRQQRVRVVSLKPPVTTPQPKVVAPDWPSRVALGFGGILTYVISGLAAIGMFAGLYYVLVHKVFATPVAAGKRSTYRHDQARAKPAEPERHYNYERDRHPQSAKAKAPKPRKKSKVVQRAGWFS